MAYDMDNLGGLVTEVIKASRLVTDPWGFGIEAEVLRADHPDWKKCELDIAADRPEAAKIRRVSVEAAFSEMAPSGFRKTKKLSRPEAHRKMLQQLSEKGEVTTDIEDLREKKAGIAAVLVKRLTVHGETLVKAGGVQHDLATVEGRASFLDSSTYRFEQDGEIKERAIPVYKRGEDGEPVIDDLGEPVEEHLGGWNMGDAVAAWLVEESKELAAYAEGTKAAALEQFGGTSNGSIGTGSPGQPTSGEF